MKLGEIAHMRSGDKGDISNISLIPYDEAHYEWIGEIVTEEFVRGIFGPLVKGDVTRYEVPGIRAYNFVLTDALGGGVSRTLALDIHGKAYGGLLADADVPTPPTTPHTEEHQQ